MLRREFIALLCTTAAAWPLAAGALQTERMRRIGVLMALSETDREARAWLLEFKRGLVESGWTDGGNIRLEIRWAGSNVDLMRKFAEELVTLNPDVILANSTPVTLALQRETQTVPSGAAAQLTQLSVSPAGGKPATQVTLFNQGLVQILQAAVTGLEPKKPYVLALATKPDGSGKLKPIASL
jgi:hypothetical protein